MAHNESILYERKIEFSKLNNKKIEIVGVDKDCSADKIISYLFSKNKWNLPKPKLVLSVIGGDKKKFKLSNSMKKAFKKGIIKVTASTDSWIITNGCNSDVAKLVNEALAENFSSSRAFDLAVIGILNSNNFVFKDKVEKHNFDEKSSECGQHAIESILHETNHTHFILIENDTNTNKNYDESFKFRSRLENELIRIDTNLLLKTNKVSKNHDFENESNKQKSGIPLIQICVNGSFDTLLMIKESLSSKIPILILEGSKGCADLIANSIYHDKENLKDLIKNSGIIEVERPDYDNMLKIAFDSLNFILNNMNLINIFGLDNEDSENIESAILTSFLNSQKENNFDKLRLVTLWNRIDIAKDNILTGEDLVDSGQLFNLFEIALIDNKPDFVQLFLEHDAELHLYITNYRLCYLYNSEQIHEDLKRTPFYFELREMFGSRNSETLFITFEKIRKFLKKFVFEDSHFKFIPVDFKIKSENDYFTMKKYLDGQSDYEDKDSLFFENNQSWLEEAVEEPVLNLFIWALVSYRIEIAKIFWRMANNQMANALIAATLYQNLSKKIHNKSQLKNISTEFLEMAIGVLDFLEISSKEFLNFIYLEQTIDNYNLDCLKIANLGKHKLFIASLCVQNLLNEKWNSGVESRNGLWPSLKKIISCFSFGLLAPFLVTTTTNNQSNSDEYLLLDNDDENINDLRVYKDESMVKYIKHEEKNIFSKYLRNVYKFLRSPSVVFIYDSFAYIIFLAIFSYFLLCEFDYKDTIDNLEFDNNLNSTNKYKQVDITRYPNVFEYILLVWILSFVIEEIRQFTENLEGEIPFKLKLERYLRDKWNYLDMTGCLFFVLGFAFHTLSIVTSENIFRLSKICYCVDLTVWYLRLLHVSLVFKNLGPKLVMINKMVKDLIFFMCLVGIFVCAFGITTEASLYSSSKFDLNLMRRILTKGYWPVYGTIKILEDFDKFFANCTGKDCPDPYGMVYSFLVLMIYMVVANVLLVNLLIAMFSSTFQRLHENTDLIWKFQLYNLVYEYVEAPLFPPPFCLFISLFKIIKNLFGKNKTENGRKFHNLMESMKELEKKAALGYLELKEENQRETNEVRLKFNSEKLELLEQKLNALLENKLKYEKINS